ncbi:MAG: hypothetical protein HPY50_05860 [Firmicutes bacterium]|nr:hypothetical protein [Bacillota bacterium]
MEFLNCPECGRMFRYTNSLLCNACQRAEDSEFQKVREFIRENPGSDVLQVSEATGVRLEKIMRFLREGRITSCT